MKLTEKTTQVLDFLKGNGGRAEVKVIGESIGRVGASLTASINDLCKKELAYRDKVEVEGEEKPVTYVQLTDAGMNFVPTED